MNEVRVDKLNQYWMLAAKIEIDTLVKSSEHINRLCTEIPRNKPHLDSLIFARHNTGNSNVPPDMGFEPSPVWHDEPALSIEDAAKNFLRNVLLKSKGQLFELKRDVDGKRREVESMRKVRKAIRDGSDKRDEVEVVKALFNLQETLHESERQKITAEVEILTITSVVGDVSIGARNHNFKSETFTIPTHCDYCGDRIWGLSAKGFSCRDCGFTCHSKCEMKIPAECPGELNKDEKKRVKLQRQESAHAAMRGTNGSGTDVSGEAGSLNRSDTLNTLSSGYSAPQRSVSRTVSGTSVPQLSENDTSTRPPKMAPRPRIIAPPPTIQRTHNDDSSADGPSSRSNEKRCKTMYAFRKNGAEEINVDEGQELIVLEDDGKQVEIVMLW
jgi:formin-binding protein 1